MEKKSGVNIKIGITGFVLFCSLCTIVVRLYVLHVVKGEMLSSKSERQYSRVIRIKKNRGTIYDRNLNELAISVKAYSVFANPHEVDDPYTTSFALAQVLKVQKKKLLKSLKSKKSFVWLKRKIGPYEVEKIKNKKLSGIGFIEENKRIYPKRESASNIIGFVGIDNKGLSGLEYEFNSFIEGEEEIIVIEKDAKGRNIEYAKKWLHTGKGGDLVTTIDGVIQHIAEKELKKTVEAFSAKGGVAIVMDPTNGDLLAIANFPDFNPNSFNQYRPLSWVNRTVSHSYEPGSTFKLILVAAAVEEKLVKVKDLFFCENGQIDIGGITIHDTHKYQWLTTKQVIGKSSNVGAVKIGKRLEKELFYSYIDKFGFGKKTNIDLPGESSGIVRRPGRWTEASLGAISIGHEIAVTPIQLITALSAVAHQGLLRRPRIVQSIIKDGKVVKTFPSQVVQRVISEKTSRKVTDMLTYVVTDGTGKLAAVEGYSVAGKTGTAQKIDKKTGKYSKEKFFASFVGYLPAYNPRVSILVIIDEPQEVIYGGKVAAPAFREIGRQVMRYLRVPPDKEDRVNGRSI